MRPLVAFHTHFSIVFFNRTPNLTLLRLKPQHPDTQRSFSSPCSGDWCLAKWSQSSCTTEVTAGTATTASPVPAVTRSCWMEPVSSWTSTPQRTITCWMAMLPHQVGCLPPAQCLLFWPRNFSKGCRCRVVFGILFSSEIPSTLLFTALTCS